MPETVKAGAPMPEITLSAVGGGHVGTGGPGWKMVVVYRGLHCPKCKAYLTRLEELKDGFAAIDTEIVAISGDPEAKAIAFRDEVGLSLPIGYGMTVAEMRRLGLYVSDPRSPEETDRPFPEPGLFVINPAGDVQIVDISNAPFSRPDLDGILGGLTFIQQKDYPICGAHAG